MTHHLSSSSSQVQRRAATGVVYRYTLIAAATGAVPVPAASLAIVGENAAMVNEIAGCFGVPISVATVVGSMGLASSVNVIGRTVFVEGAKVMGWFAGPLGVGGIMALGASTAALQTMVVGYLAMAIAENGGRMLNGTERRQALASAREEFDRGAWREREREHA